MMNKTYEAFIDWKHASVKCCFIADSESVVLIITFKFFLLSLLVKPLIKD